MNALREKLLSDYGNNGVSVYHCPDTISPDSYRKIKFILHDYTIEHNVTSPLYELPGLDKIGDEWVVAHSNQNSLGLCGTFPKRLAKYLYEKWEFKAQPDLMGVIGNTARDSMIKEYYFDIVDRFNWESGDYGDDGSCYWGCRAGAKEILIECFNALAIRFYKKVDNESQSHRFPDGYDGYGRAWIVPYNDESLIIYNAYPENFKLVSIARMLSTILGMSYKQISLYFNGDSTGTVWVNNHSGYLIHPYESHHQELDSIDLEYEHSSHTCYNCGATLDDDEIYSYGDDEYCQDCYYEYFVDCQWCNDAIARDDANVVGDEYYCDHCLHRHFTQCDNCGEYVGNDDIYYSDGESESFCESCWQDLIECQDCGNMFRESNLTSLDDANGDSFYLCNDCIKPYKCQNCGDVHYFDRDETMFCVDKNREYCVCIDCIDNLYCPTDSLTLIRCDYCHCITTRTWSHRISSQEGYEFACDNCQEQNIPQFIANVPNLYELVR